MKPADRGWLVLFGGITGYELAAIRKGWELLSQAMNRYRANRLRRLVIDAVVYYLALHLTRRVPRRFDLLTRLAEWVAERFAR